MNELQIFENDEFGKVRTVVIDGEPWLVGKDVAEILDYSNPQKAIRDHVDEEDRTVNDSFTVNGTQGVLINESGLYSLVMRSKLPSAKRFKRWVTSEVLPTIRKTGQYKAPALPDFTNPVVAARAWADEVEKKQLAEAKVAALAPKADFYDTVADSESLMSMADTCKILDMGIGRNKLFALLRDKKILQKDNIPYQQYVTAGYFKVVEGKYEVNENVVVTKTTYVKQKGIDYIRKLLSRNAN